ncbi:hypothetical protein EW146_g4359 [Bondarzewia mesenterica]|uniref:Arrestin-like N-terminal domain-containing protein n=1 Tax=Bondarzewia mesenterica TaxID=1095465 RepID=A0A4S4LUS8_9AGAM|nr:hypothetical protein EW146_g4359 [Bondarzewia mesenterica]
MSLPDSPAYSPSAPAPLYSPEPHSDETQLALTIRRVFRPRPSGTFALRAHGITLLLRDQEVGVPSPTFGANALVGGNVELDSTEDIISVTLKLDGLLNLTVVGVATNDVVFFSRTCTIWKLGNPSTASCSRTLPFHTTIPESYQDGNRTHSLPPTYSAVLNGVHDLLVNCCYRFTIDVTKSGLWKARKTLRTPLIFLPRTRPHQPIISSPFPFYATIKSLPEEWYQIISTMLSLNDSGIEPIECHLFIPSVRIYSITDTIPFFLQLCASPTSFEEFLRPKPPTPSILYLFRNNFHPSSQPVVRVFILRQIEAVVGAHHAFHTHVLGEGTLRAIPPGISVGVTQSGQAEDGYETLNWEGEVKCRKDVLNGGFSLGRLIVKDFICLSIIPASPKSSRLLEHKHMHPIRLVTDSFMDGREDEF